MSDLYWITVLGNLHGFFVILSVIVFLTFIGCLIVYLADKDDYDENEEYTKWFEKSYKWFIGVFIGILLAIVFIPSTDRLYMIYGVGTALDYCKDNKEIQKLPDNAIKAINKYLENTKNEK